MTARVVLLYERPGCHLCDGAFGMLAPLAREMRFDVRRIDIESDDALLRRYALEIPVVALEDGTELIRAPIEPATLRKVLAGAWPEHGDRRRD